MKVLEPSNASYSYISVEDGRSLEQCAELSSVPLSSSRVFSMNSTVIEDTGRRISTDILIILIILITVIILIILI